jgi:arylsulfatase A-like enzyme
MTPREAQSERDAYDDSIAYLDNELGLLLETLEERGLLDNTMVIVTGDHGEAFGEHGYFTHGDNLYLNQLHVPLLIRFPKHDSAGMRISESVSLRDLPATILSVVAPGERAWLPGTSVARFWKPNAVGGKLPKAYLLSEVNLAPIMGRPRANSSRAVMQSLVVNRYHYIRNIDGSEELYDFISDPPEDRDLSPSSEGREAIEVFRSLLDARSQLPVEETIGDQ